jgi:MoaA/NifB/PqqE/SkfB family radical SAM enzyme
MIKTKTIGNIDPKTIQAEYSKLRGPLNIMWDMTNRCNLCCMHCYNRSGKGAHYKDLSDEEMMVIAEHIVEAGIPVVCFCGGEPLLRYPLLIKAAKVLSASGIVVNMVTNGLLLTEEKVRMLRASGVNGIQISLDSYSAEIHDKFRGLDGAFQKALEAIKLILNSGIIPEVTFIPTKLNYKGIGQVIDLLYELGIKKLNSMPFIPIGRGYDNRSRLKMTSQEKWEFEWLVRKKLNQYVDFDFNNGDPLEHIYLFSQNPNAKTITYEIRCNGDIVVSPYLPFLYGNAVKTSLNKLWDDGLKDVWKIPEIKDTARRIISLEEIEKQTNRPWNNQDIQLYCERM